MYNTCYSNLEVLVISLVRVRVCVPFLHLCLVASRLHLVLEVQRVMHTHVHSNAERSATADWRALRDWLFLHANNGSCCSPGVRSCSDDAVDAALRPLLECAACQPTRHSLIVVETGCSARTDYFFSCFSQSHLGVGCIHGIQCIHCVFTSGHVFMYNVFTRPPPCVHQPCRPVSRASGRASTREVISLPCRR